VIAHRLLRAPQQHGAVLLEPPLPELQDHLAQGCSLDRSDLHLAGQPLPELRRQARRAAIAAAHGYLAEAGQALPHRHGEHVLVAGHQPELFHPGVWVKNFALCGLAREHGLVPLNLVVDNDTVKATALGLPCWHAEQASQAESYRIDKIPFDHQATETPYEESPVLDEELFAALPEHAGRCTRCWPFTPLLADYWTLVMRHRQRTSLLGERLAAGRRDLEQRWGCGNLEVPVSRVCDTEPFAWFAGHLFADVQRFHTIYNDTVHEYRRVHGLRSRNHPVPDLARDGDWREVPFWAWRAGGKRRGRLFVRPAADRFELRSDREAWPALPAALTALVSTWQELRRQGFKIRSRALTNTLYTRLFVADTFVHGIGGGKYDELTDEIVRRFYGIEPPPFVVLSATLLLPLTTFPATMPQRYEMAQRLRDLHWNPQRHLAPTVDGPARELAAQKKRLLAELTEPIGRERHRALRQLTEQLEPFVHPAQQAIGSRLAEVDAELRANAVLRRRDFAFCLYPEALLRSFCEGFLEPSAKR
jgi:hypothetical protein